MKGLKRRLKEGETLSGCWLNLGSSVTAEIAGQAGFDWLLIDLEHGAGTEQEALHQLQAIEHTPAASVVRVESCERQRIHRVLDLGAEGIMCPRINNGGEARKFASALRYPPDGNRGVARIVRASGFGRHFSDYYRDQNENILGVMQVETIEVLEHLNEVAAIDAVDVLFVGPADLSMALGVFGQFDHPEFKKALGATVSAARNAGKAAGILLSNPDDYTVYQDMGMQMIACGADTTFVEHGARAIVDKLKAAGKISNTKR